MDIIFQNPQLFFNLPLTPNYCHFILDHLDEHSDIGVKHDNQAEVNEF